MRIYVTKDDIAHGKPCNAGKCPIARALQRRFPKAFVSVGPWGMTLEDSLLEIPTSARNFIARFDAKQTVRPFSFKL